MIVSGYTHTQRCAFLQSAFVRFLLSGVSICPVSICPVSICPVSICPVSICPVSTYLHTPIVSSSEQHTQGPEDSQEHLAFTRCINQSLLNWTLIPVYSLKMALQSTSCIINNYLRSVFSTSKARSV